MDRASREWIGTIQDDSGEGLTNAERCLTGTAVWGANFCDFVTNKFGDVAHRSRRRYVSRLRLRPG